MYLRSTDVHGDLNCLINRCVFNLHPDFPNHKRGSTLKIPLKFIVPRLRHVLELKSTPFAIQESGYGGFDLVRLFVSRWLSRLRHLRSSILIFFSKQEKNRNNFEFNTILIYIPMPKVILIDRRKATFGNIAVHSVIPIRVCVRKSSLLAGWASLWGWTVRSSSSSNILFPRKSERLVLCLRLTTKAMRTTATKNHYPRYLNPSFVIRHLLRRHHRRNGRFLPLPLPLWAVVRKSKLNHHFRIKRRNHHPYQQQQQQHQFHRLWRMKISVRAQWLNQTQAIRNNLWHRRINPRRSSKKNRVKSRQSKIPLRTRVSPLF